MHFYARICTLFCNSWKVYFIYFCKIFLQYSIMIFKGNKYLIAISLLGVYWLLKFAQFERTIICTTKTIVCVLVYDLMLGKFDGQHCSSFILSQMDKETQTTLILALLILLLFLARVVLWSVPLRQLLLHHHRGTTSGCSSPICKTAIPRIKKLDLIGEDRNHLLEDIQRVAESRILSNEWSDLYFRNIFQSFVCP